MRIAFFFSHSFRALKQEVSQGIAPKERLYGIHELESAGHSIDIRDKRFSGKFGKLTEYLKQWGINLIHPSDLLAILKADRIYVKDNFSTLITIAAFFSRKKITYCDSIFYIPNSKIKRFFIWLNIKLSDQIIGYSHSQRDLWINTWGKSAEKIQIINYVIDTEFYLQRKHSKTKNSNHTKLIAVGRDPGREYTTLVRAMHKSPQDTQLDVVIPKYLLPPDYAKAKNIQHHENLSYDALFSLYANADAAIVPIRANVNYPSGIRAILEAILMGTPVITTRNAYLCENFDNRTNIIFYDAESESSLNESIAWLKNNSEAASIIASNALSLFATRFNYHIEMQKLAQAITAPK